MIFSQCFYKITSEDFKCFTRINGLMFLLRIISNDKYISVEHRVLANKVGLRVSGPCFFDTNSMSSSKLYGPISELLLEDNPPKYHATTVKDYHEYFRKKGLDVTSALLRYKI
ncbi:hypothetical protein RDI58_024846 [Solanum bulbocastanum]|uniref:Isopenicillin N synthase-like Fe(2+) 2OG dioxygenase domain-containing protein n=1 Tax=Solanum bulbocastanum TaxID=147425 RepID=A0AAN8SYD3_SOLBU